MAEGPRRRGAPAPQDDDDQQPPRPTQPAEDGDPLTEEDEAILDKVAARIPAHVLQASIKRTLEWAKTLKKREGES